VQKHIESDRVTSVSLHSVKRSQRLAIVVVVVVIVVNIYINIIVLWCNIFIVED